MRGLAPTKCILFDLSCISNESTHTYKVYPVWPKFYPKWEDTHLQSISCLSWVWSQMRGYTPTKYILFVLSFIPNERTHTYKVYPVWPELYLKREDTHLQSISCLTWAVTQMRGHTPIKYILFDLSCISNERTHTYKVYPVWPKFDPKWEDLHLQSLKVCPVWLLKFNLGERTHLLH